MACAQFTGEVIPMVYRKGELSKSAIDRGWPHQVALPADRCRGSNYSIIRHFCEGLSLCARTHSFRRDNIDMCVFCFAERDHAARFQQRFGGELMDPASRPNWPGSARKIDAAAEARHRNGRCTYCDD
jgi:hypothetical protein